MKKFTELNLCSALQNNLARNGFETPTPVQAQAIPPALAGTDVVATAQTGTGKTLAFVLPILEALLAKPVKSGVAAVILTPTRELAMQIDEVFTLLAHGTKIRAAVVVGGLGEGGQLKAIRAGAQVVIATPGRLNDFLERRLVNLGHTRIFVLDEADRMLDMGFLPSIRRIIAKLPQERQTLFYSATIDPAISHLINDYINDPARITVGSTRKPGEDIDLHYYEVEPDRKLGLLQHMLENEEGTFLVFMRTKHGAERLGHRLKQAGIKAAAIHGDRTQGQRSQALKGFQEGRYRVLVATDVAARGIHVDTIAHVVNYDWPKAAEDFIHRVGRTGRAGARGTATTFTMPIERGEVRRLEKALSLKLTRREVPASIPADERNRAKVVVAGRAPTRTAKPVETAKPDPAASIANGGRVLTWRMGVGGAPNPGARRGQKPRQGGRRARAG